MEKHNFRSFFFILFLLSSFLFLLNKGKVLAEGFAVTAQDHHSFLPIVYKAFPAPSKLSGIIFDDRVDDRLSDAKVCIESGQCVTTHMDGEYSFENIVSGEYQVTVTKMDYISKTKTIVLPSGANIRQDFRLLPELSDGQIRITVTWNDVKKWPPSNIDNDLDIHLWTPFSESSGYYHISVDDNKGNCQNFENESYPCLEADATQGSGPEIVALYPVVGDFAFGVLNYYDGYQGVPSITDLDVKVVVERYEGSTETFYVPQTGTGDFWYVFNIEDGVILTEDLNCITWAGNPLVDPPVCPTP